ncbi:MAG: T9SS type A sorting domain-containing protein [Bacteroidota bacterium]|nr:T9SS type A sorting domain-containing protein [Bacteroidota bacterium]
MKRILTLLFLIIIVTGFFAQSNQKGDTRSTNQNTVIRIEGSAQNGWVKGDNDASAGASVPAAGNENVSFNATAEGIYVTILSGTNKIKLYALTGQLLLNGDLTQGRFFIPARKGIYFLKVNNKSYKVICK